MRIVISGGWGYGNLGDDAILDSTIQVLRRRYSGCEINVLTYDLDDSRAHLNIDVRLHHCLHRSIDRGSCRLFCSSIDADSSRIQRAILRVKFALTETAVWFNYAVRNDDSKNVERVIKDADLYVMAGGGYFNEMWLSKTRSQVRELSIANKNNVPVYIIGPTIGKFEGALNNQVKAIFSIAKIVTVRDLHSLADAEKMSRNVKLIPDIALSSWLPAAAMSDEKVLGVVFNNQSADFQQKTASGLAAFLLKNPNWQVVLFVSRLWRYDYIAATRLQRALASTGVSSAIVLSSDFRELERGLGSSRIVVSENLHGLILAARNLVPVLAVNDYPEGSPNYKKFIAFLGQSESQKYCISSKSTAADISDLIADLELSISERKAGLKKLRESVFASYASAL
jgi:polysaccharide pyruvyl transferase WcaK-like protein